MGHAAVAETGVKSKNIPAPESKRKRVRHPLPPLPKDLEAYRLIDEKAYATMRGCSIRTVQNERFHRIGCPFHKVGGGKSVRYRLGEVLSFLERGRVEVKQTGE